MLAIAFNKDVFNSAKEEVRQELGLSVVILVEFGFQIAEILKALGILGGNEEVKNFSVEIANVVW